MSRFPGHTRHKGKKRNRKNVEKNASHDDTISPFQRNPEQQRTEPPKHDGPRQEGRQAAHRDARRPATGKATGPGGLNGSTGQRNASSKAVPPGGTKRPAAPNGHSRKETGHPGEAQRHSTEAQRSGRRQGTHSRSRYHGKHDRSRRREGEPEIRGLRGPVERTPDVVYEPQPASNDAGRPNQGDVHGTRHQRSAANGHYRHDRPEHHGNRHFNGSGEGGRGNGGEGKRPGEKHHRRHAGGSARHGREARPLYAALDLGTNNCRLLIALPQQRGRFRVIDGFSRIVRLGEGMAQSGELSQVAMDRALEALKICAGKMISHDISRHRLIATEACRQAGNGEAFLARVYEHTGMKLETIDRKTEAYLAAEGCGSLIDRKAEAAVLFDIGGGSSELALVKRNRRNAPIAEQIDDWTSLPIGVVTLAERFGGKMVDRSVFERMVEEVLGHLAGFADNEEFSRVWRKGRVHLLGTSGTVTTLAGIHLKLPRYERRLVDGLWMQSGDVDTVLQQLIGMDYDQRASSPCIGQERADLVMAGCAILEAIRRTWPCQTLRVADRGLREGALTQLMSADNAWLPPKRGRWPRKKQR